MENSIYAEDPRKNSARRYAHQAGGQIGSTLTDGAWERCQPLLQVTPHWYWTVKILGQTEAETYARKGWTAARKAMAR